MRVTNSYSLFIPIERLISRVLTGRPKKLERYALGNFTSDYDHWTRVLVCEFCTTDLPFIVKYAHVSSRLFTINFSPNFQCSFLGQYTSYYTSCLFYHWINLCLIIFQGMVSPFSLRREAGNTLSLEILSKGSKLKIPQVDGPIPDPYDEMLSTPNVCILALQFIHLA